MGLVGDCKCNTERCFKNQLYIELRSLPKKKVIMKLMFLSTEWPKRTKVRNSEIRKFGNSEIRPKILLAENTFGRKYFWGLDTFNIFLILNISVKGRGPWTYTFQALLFHFKVIKAEWRKQLGLQKWLNLNCEWKISQALIVLGKSFKLLKF